DPVQGVGQFLHVGDIARINVVTQADATLTVEYIAQSHLPQIVTSLFVVASLRQAVALIGAGGPGIEVGRVIGQQPAADQLFVFPHGQQPLLGLFQFIGSATCIAFDVDLIEGV